MCEEVAAMMCGFGSVGLLLHELFVFKRDAITKTHMLGFTPVNARVFSVLYSRSHENEQVFALGAVNSEGQGPFFLGQSLLQLPLSFENLSEEHAALSETLRCVVTAELLSLGAETIEYSSSTRTIPTVSVSSEICLCFVESDCNKQFCVKMMTNSPDNQVYWIREFVFKTSKAIHPSWRVQPAHIVASFCVPSDVKAALRG